MCQLGHSSAVPVSSCQVFPVPSQELTGHCSLARNQLTPCSLWAAAQMSSLPTSRNAVALLESSCVFLGLCIGRDSLSHPPICISLCISALAARSHRSQREKPHVCALPCKYLFSLYISYCVWVCSLTLSCHMCGSWWHQLYEISTHAKNSWRSWNKFWVRWVSWAGTGISQGTVAVCHAGSLTRSMWALLTPKADSPWKKGFDSIQIVIMAERTEL